MGMESPDNCRKADDSYRARSVGRSSCLPSTPAEGANGKAPRLPRNRLLDYRFHLGVGDTRLPVRRFNGMDTSVVCPRRTYRNCRVADEAEGEIERSGTHISTLTILHELFLGRRSKHEDL
jgi:hypothetical protein